jgi:hypothetical protein
VKSILRSLLVCFLLMALPFQAFASASMRPVVSQQPPCHQQVAQASMDGMHHEQVKHAQVKHDHVDKHDKSKCGACAACCVGAAMAAGLPLKLPLAPPQFVSIPFRAGHLPSVDPVLPERPPRPLLA